MGSVFKAFKIRIYPNQAQETLILKSIGCARFTYNYLLAERIEVYKKLKDDKRALYEYKYKDEVSLKKEFEWMSEVSKFAIQSARRDLSTSFQNFFNSLKGLRKGEKVGFPQFHRKGQNDSYREYITNNNITVDFQTRTVKLPKLGKIKFRDSRIFFEGKIKQATVSRTKTGKYFVSVLYEQDLDLEGVEVRDGMKVIGLDMSLQKFYVDNLGNSPDYQKPYRSNQKKLSHYQRKLSKKQKGSKNREKARLKVAKVHEKIVNSRSDFVHKLSTKLVKENDVIVVENLSLKGMSQALKLGKSVMDLGYSEFVRQLQYKALWNNKTFLKADKWFASSKTCNFCGFVNKDLLLQERVWECPNCHEIHNRDTNAGTNLKNYGLKELGLVQPKIKPVESSDLLTESKESVKVQTVKQEAFGSLDRR